VFSVERSKTRVLGGLERGRDDAARNVSCDEQQRRPVLAFGHSRDPVEFVQDLGLVIDQEIDLGRVVLVQPAIQLGRFSG
jgi:hypothetical protein